VKQVQALSGGVFGTVGSWLDLVRVRVSLTLALTLTRWAAGSTWLGLRVSLTLALTLTRWAAG